MKTGIIYKITHNQSNITYVGSTFNTLAKRWYNHKIKFKYNKNRCCISKYFKQYGIENFTCILVKKYNVFDRIQLRAYEQLWINKLKSINKQCALNLLKKEKKRLADKKYYNNNKQKIKLINKIYRENNKQKIKQYKQQYRIDNKQKIKEYKQQYDRKYYNDNKDKIQQYMQQKINCECGSVVRYNNLPRHKKTKKHINFIKEKCNDLIDNFNN